MTSKVKKTIHTPVLRAKLKRLLCVLRL